MHFSVITTLALEFLLWQLVSSSRHSIFANQTSASFDKVDNLLGKFFTEFNEVYLQKNAPRQVTIIGASIDDLRQTQSLFESYPYVTCADRERCAYPEAFNSGSFRIIFLDDLGEKTLIKNLNILSGCRSECEFLFLFKGSIIKSNDISTFFIRAILQGVVHLALVHLEKDAIKIHHPDIDMDCSLRVDAVSIWRSGTDSSKIHFPFHRRLPNFNGCPVSVGTIPSVPKMVTEEHENGSVTIVGGTEGMLVLLIAEALNFTTVVKYPSVPVDPNEALKESMINDVASGIIELAIGRLRPINTHNRKIEFSRFYDDECVTWGVSRRMSTTANLVWEEFPLKVWALIGTIFAFTCVIGYAIHNMNFRQNGHRKDVGICVTVLDILAINLGYPVIYVPIFTSGRSIFILVLFYSTIITTSYKTSLASILATVQPSTTIFDARGIIEANFKAGGSRYNLNILKNQDNGNKFHKKLIERYEAIHNSTELMHRLKFEHDFACLGRRSAFSYEKWKAVGAHELINFDVFSTCVLTYSSVIVFREGSFLRDPVDKLIWKVIESGILKHLDSASHLDDQTLERKISDRFSEERIRQKFENIFIFYSGCLSVCLLVFFVELITPKFKTEKKEKNTVHNSSRTVRFLDL